MTTVSAVPLPQVSRIIHLAAGAYFFDAYEMRAKSISLSAIATYLNAVSLTPAWIEQAMLIRNRVVGLVGIKDLGSFGSFEKTKPAADYRVGDRVGIFKIHSLSDEEVILEDSDKHLDAKVSICKTGTAACPSWTVSTIVHVHNMLGRLYLLPVLPAHRVIVPVMMQKIGDLQ